MGDFSNNLLLPNRLGQAEIPKRKASIPPPAATEQVDDGLIRIKGSGASVINLNHSESENHTRTVLMETQRTYDEVRIKNKDNPNQHVDVKRPKKVNAQSNENTRGAPPRPNKGAAGPANVTTVYTKQEESETIEVLTEDITDANPEWTGGGGGSAAP